MSPVDGWNTGDGARHDQKLDRRAHIRREALHLFQGQRAVKGNPIDFTHRRKPSFLSSPLLSALGRIAGDGAEDDLGELQYVRLLVLPVLGLLDVDAEKRQMRIVDPVR